MVSYKRPDFPVVTFRDTSGAIIEYGRRWRDRQGRMPPEDTYSVVTHPERFAPLHTVADALIDYLTKRYEATASEDLAFVADLMFGHDDVLRAVRVEPASTDAAPLTFVYTNYPGVLLHTGLLHDFPFPGCGCDACDETAEGAADELEEIVMAVAEGRYQETYGGGDERPLPPGRWAAWPGPASPVPDTAPLRRLPGPWAGYRIVAPDGSFRRRGEGMLRGYPAERLETAKTLLNRLNNGWQPWQLPRT
jgi:hypothetical protein